MYCTSSKKNGWAESTEILGVDGVCLQIVINGYYSDASYRILLSGLKQAQQQLFSIEYKKLSYIQGGIRILYLANYTAPFLHFRGIITSSGVV